MRRLIETITGNLEQINEQLKNIREKHTYKITRESSEIIGDFGNKRRVFTFELELTEK